MLDSTQTGLVVVGIVPSIVTTFAVALRIWAQSMNGTRLKLDDWTILLCLLITYMNNFTLVYGVYHAGFGAPATQIVGPTAVAYGKAIFADTFFWQTASGTCKISILLFYHRIFFIRRFRQAMYILIGIVIAWMLGCIIANIFAWWPVQAAWTREGHPTIDYPLFLILNCATSTVLDIVTIACPLFMIQKLNLSRKKKVIIGSIFMMGATAVIATIVLFPYLGMYNESYSSLPADKASALKLGILSKLLLLFRIEVDLALIAACLPTYAPLLRTKPIKYIIRLIRSSPATPKRNSRTWYGYRRQRPSVNVEELKYGYTGVLTPLSRTHMTSVDHDSISSTIWDNEPPGIIRKEQTYTVTYVDAV